MTNRPNSDPSIGDDASEPHRLAQIRRRLLMASLGKGSAVMAAASIPMHALATQSTRCKTVKTPKNGAPGPCRATVSGMNSLVGSMASSWPESCGYGQSHYCPTGNKTNDKSKWPVATDCDRTFAAIFGSGSTKTCYTIVKACVSGTATATDLTECRWVLAYMNASGSKCQTTYNYPYTQAEVVSLYKGVGVNGGSAPSRSACVTFFQNYMETLS